jgi:hypothetical protein
MTEQSAENVCSLTQPAPTLMRGWSEILTEALDKFRETLASQFRAGLRAVEAGSIAAAARDPGEFRAGLAACYRHGLDWLRPLAELQSQGTRFATAWGEHLTGGMRTVNEAEYQRRLAECAACEFFRDNHCLSCGCRLGGDVVAKARWADGQCPLGKWGK